MIPMSLLQGKSVGVQCIDDFTVIQCAQFEDYLDDVDYTGEEENKKGNKGGGGGGNNKKKDDGTFLGVGTNVWIFLLVIGVLAIAPCVKWYKNRSKAQAAAGGGGGDDDLGFGMVKSADNSRSSKLRQESRQSMTGTMTMDGPDVVYDGGYGRTNTFSHAGNAPPTPSGHSRQNMSIHEKAALARKKKTATQMGNY